MEFNISKGAEAWHFLKIDRNPNISVETRKGRLVSYLNLQKCLYYPAKPSLASLGVRPK